MSFSVRERERSLYKRERERSQRSEKVCLCLRERENEMGVVRRQCFVQPVVGVYCFIFLPVARAEASIKLSGKQKIVN